MTGVTTRWLVPTITVFLLYFSTLTWPTSITGVTTRWLVSNHFTRANWPDFTADRFYCLLSAYLRRLRLRKNILFHNTFLDRLFDSLFYCTYQYGLFKKLSWPSIGPEAEWASMRLLSAMTQEFFHLYHFRIYFKWSELGEQRLLSKSDCRESGILFFAE